MTSMTSVVWGRLDETVYRDFRDFHGLAELGLPSLERAKMWHSAHECHMSPHESHMSPHESHMSPHESHMSPHEATELDLPFRLTR